ncbi:MAG: hypothetical protein IPH33_18355 [Bacteroidetes bacterium]|nr:hypothetical protein [Bacteroidota bacterium]
MALAYLKAHSDQLKPRLQDLRKSGTYIFTFLKAQLQKDGPTAGITMLTSCFCFYNKKSKGQLVTTGKYITWQVLPVGGIKENSLLLKEQE